MPETPSRPSSTAIPDRASALGRQLVEVHDWLRGELSRVASELDLYIGGGARPLDLRAHCLTFCAAVTRHHTSEDDTAFPELARRFPELVPVLAELRADHTLVAGILGKLTALLDTVSPANATEIRRELDGLRAILESHFRWEERRIVAALDELGPSDPTHLFGLGRTPTGQQENSTMTAVHGISLDIPTPDGVADAYLAHPDDGAPHPGVLVIQDGFGLRPSLRELTDRIAAHGYTVLTPNAFYRSGPAPVVELPDYIDTAERPEIFQQIIPMIRSLTPESFRSDANAYLDWLAASPLVTDGKVGVTGYCMGARLAVLTAANFPDRVAAVGGFHGGPLVTDTPDSPHLSVGNITAEVYLAQAGEDRHITPEHNATFDKALEAAAVPHRTEVYEGAHHGYTQSDTAAYDADSAERHYRELLALFDRNLKV